MSKIQPGSGYGFTSGGYGFTLNTENPFPDLSSGDVCRPLEVKYSKYDATGNTHFFTVCIGAVNNLVPQLNEDGVWVKLDRNTGGVMNPPEPVINVTSGVGVIYLRCGKAASPSTKYPDDDTANDSYPRIISAGGAVPSDSDSYSYLLLATVMINASEQATINPVVLNSLWTERFKCGSNPAIYWWSTV